MILLLALSCSDYGITGEKPDPTLGPDIEVEPAALDLVVCGEEEATLTVRNVGDAALTLGEVTLEGGGWGADLGALPGSLAAGAEVDLALRAEGGAARLAIASDDPDEPVVEVPLQARADAPPTVRIDAPAGETVLDAGEDLLLQGTVGDAEDGAEALAIAWRSSLEGTLGEAPATADGLTSLTWGGVGRTSGVHTVTLEARDACGQVAEASVEVCQDEGYTVDELDISSWHVEGAAIWDTHNAWVRLTEASTDQVGTAFAVDETITGDLVEIRFGFWIGGGTGADGISLTVLDTTRMTTFLGGTGCGIGYGGDAACTEGPALPGWSIEVDTYYNDGQDPTDQDHVMFTFDGDVDDPAIWAVLPEMEDTGWHTMEVRVVAPHVTVLIDGVAYIDTDLSGFTPFPGYVGFTAGTGGQTNEHRIDSLQVTAHTCEGAG